LVKVTMEFLQCVLSTLGTEYEGCVRCVEYPLQEIIEGLSGRVNDSPLVY